MVKKQLRGKTIRDTEYYYFNWLFEDQALDARIRMEHEYANYSELVQTTAEELIKFVLYQSMEFFQITYVANQSVEKTTEKSYVKFLLKYLEEHYNSLDPQLKAFYYLTSFSTNENKEHFLELQNLFSDSENRFDYSQQRNFYIALLFILHQ